MGETPLEVGLPNHAVTTKAHDSASLASRAPSQAGPLSADGGLLLEPPTWLGRVMRGLSFAMEGTCCLRGALWRLTPWRCRREAASFAALCQSERFAELAEYPRLARAIEGDIRPHYELYTARFNAAWMAVSLELSVFLTAMCRLLRPRRLVDLGSGFSSVLLRLYQREAKPRPEVWSVDTSPEWLEMTRRILRWQGIPTDHLVTWDDFVAQQPSGFDLVVHDMGSILTRRKTLRRVLDLTARGGVVVIDDANYGKVRRHAMRTLRKRGIEPHLVGAATRDKYGRYALLAAL